MDIIFRTVNDISPILLGYFLGGKGVIPHITFDSVVLRRLIGKYLQERATA
jgi:hypothetical protein